MRLDVNGTATCALHFLVSQEDIEQGEFINMVAVTAAPSYLATGAFNASLNLSSVSALSSPSLSARLLTELCSQPQAGSLFFSAGELVVGAGSCWADSHTAPLSILNMNCKAPKPNYRKAELVCFPSGDMLTCPQALQLTNTGNRRLTNITVSGDAACQAEPALILEPSASYNCTVRFDGLFLHNTAICTHKLRCC